MLPAPSLLSTLFLLQTSPPAVPPPTEDLAASSSRALAAAERAATSAERTAAANARIAQALESIAQGVGLPPPFDDPDPAATTNSKEGKNWDVTVGLGLMFITGNASTVTLHGQAAAERKTKDWIYSAQATGMYGKSRAPTLKGSDSAPEQVVALNAALQLRVDRRFNPLLSGYMLGRGETDHVRSIEFRGSGEAGLGIIWWDSKRADDSESFLRTDLALHCGRETRFHYYPVRMDLPDVSLGGVRVGATLRHSLTHDVALVNELSVLPSFIGGLRLLATNQAQFQVRLTRALAIATAFRVQYDSGPAEGKQSTDTSLSMNASVTF